MKMKKNIFKILLLALTLVFSACASKDDSSSSLDIFSSDQTEEAVALIDDANVKLKEIKQILKENDGRLDDLKTALSAKDAAKVKQISDQLINQIGLGTKKGEEALAKIDEAQRLNINDDYKSYLGLKAQSLLKYAEAYEERRKLAVTLRDNYDPKNAEQRKKVVAEFENREVTFLNLMKEAGKFSDQAILLAKEANLKKKAEK